MIFSIKKLEIEWGIHTAGMQRAAQCDAGVVLRRRWLHPDRFNFGGYMGSQVGQMRNGEKMSPRKINDRARIC
jgi:hypothetical protein